MNKIANTLSLKNADKYSHLEQTIYAGCWMLVFCIPLVMQVYSVLSGEMAEYRWESLMHNYKTLVPIFLMFLMNNYVLLPRLFWNGRKAWYFLALVVLFVLLWSIQTPPKPHPMPGMPELPAMPLRPGGQFGMFHITNLIIELCVIFANFAIKMYIYSLRRDVQMLNIQNEKMQQELAALKYQISPHFLMNTLNNIQSLIETNPVTAYRTIQQLSKMMRYLLYENDPRNVPLQKELDFMSSFIELMKLRYPDSVRISTDFPAEDTQVSIPPLLFISFLENAFKHGIDYERESMITVKVCVEDRWLIFRCANYISQAKEKVSGGIGIRNVRRRLDLIYGDRYELNISQNDGLYVVEMKLPI